MQIFKRFILLALTQFLYNIVQSHPISENIWIGTNFEYLEFSHDTLILDGGYHVNIYGFKIIRDTLNIYSWDFKDNKEKQNLYSAKFKIDKINKDSLVLIPLNSLTTNYFTETSIIKFLNKSVLIDSNLKFEKMQFTSSGCFGDCPEYKMIIDSLGFVNLYAGFNKHKLKGYYQGKLSKSQLNNLKSILSRSQLNRFPENLHGAIDAPIYSFKFYFNNTFRKSDGCFVPYFFSELKYYLLRLPQSIKLKQVQNKIEFE